MHGVMKPLSAYTIFKLSGTDLAVYSRAAVTGRCAESSRFVADIGNRS